MDNGGWDLFAFLCFDYLKSHIVDGGIVKHHDAAVRPRFNMYSAILSEFIVTSSEIISDGLYCYIEFVGNLVCGAIWQTVFDATKFVEGDCFSHNSIFRVSKCIKLML